MICLIKQQQQYDRREGSEERNRKDGTRGGGMIRIYYLQDCS